MPAGRHRTDKALLVEPHVAHLLHIGAHHRHIVAILALNELGAGGNLLGEPVRAEIMRWGEGVDGGAKKHRGRAGELAAGEEFGVVAHDPDGFQERHAVEIEHRLGAGLVAGLHAVTGQAEHVLHTHGGRAENIALDGNAVLVTTGNLQDRGIAHAGEQGADADRGHVRVGARGIDRVDAIDPAVKDRGALVDVVRVGAVGRVELGGDGEFAAALAAKGCHVLAHDHRGHGSTTAADAPLRRFARRNGAEKVLADCRAVHLDAIARHPGLPVIVFGHSMGGHGALTLAMKTPGRFSSVSAFSPICNPSDSDWGRKQFTAYLGADADWEAHDAARLMRQDGIDIPVLIDTGTDDQFGDLLRTEALAQAMAEKRVAHSLRMQKGYDHSYFFVARFIEEHIAHHADALWA